MGPELFDRYSDVMEQSFASMGYLRFPGGGEFTDKKMHYIGYDIRLDLVLEEHNDLDDSYYPYSESLIELSGEYLGTHGFSSKKKHNIYPVIGARRKGIAHILSGDIMYFDLSRPENVRIYFPDIDKCKDHLSALDDMLDIKDMHEDPLIFSFGDYLLELINS